MLLLWKTALRLGFSNPCVHDQIAQPRNWEYSEFTCLVRCVESRNQPDCFYEKEETCWQGDHSCRSTLVRPKGELTGRTVRRTENPYRYQKERQRRESTEETRRGERSDDESERMTPFLVRPIAAHHTTVTTRTDSLSAHLQLRSRDAQPPSAHTIHSSCADPHSTAWLACLKVSTTSPR